jgi:hypothetical protein
MKIPLDGEKPTLVMLTNVEKLHPKDKPVANLAIKTLAKCRAAYAPVYAMLPATIVNLMHGNEREQDALIAELYNGKITFGEYNVAANRIIGRLSEALSGLQKPQETVSAPAANKTAAVKMPPPRPKPEQATVPSSNQVRLALIIGNSKYVNLPKLPNPANDARAVAEVFQKMGYKTELLLDASEQNIRQAVRKFANESDKADTAVVFYAGHGAQVNGNNYLLPVDIDIPRTEADIQFTGLRVDDLVNSVRSNVKIVFLDACRDNPALFKNIVKGRGASPVGLAPASASNFDQRQGGGVFIAYATDAGAVADDGQEKHSPFTEALLRNLLKPISIDDMFSLVTREVRLVTKNAQRPYKYASLENIICIPRSCSTAPVATANDVFQQARQSEADEFQIAMTTKSADALETYLEKYPETSKRADILREIGNLRRAEFSEWTLYELSTAGTPQYMKLNSIQQFGDKATAQVKYLVERPEQKKLPNGKDFPEGAYEVELTVWDCKKPRAASAETTVYNRSGDVIYHYKWGDPRHLNLAIGFDLMENSIGAAAQKLACREENPILLVSKQQLSTNSKFESLSSTVDGEGEIFYRPIPRGQGVDADVKESLVYFRMRSEQELKLNEKHIGFKFVGELDHFMLKCTENKSAMVESGFYDSSLNLIHMALRNVNWTEFGPFSPIAMLRDIVCNKEFAGIGVQVNSVDGFINVVKVVDGTPAERVGVKTDDVITQVDGESLQGLPVDKVIERLRGQAGTEVKLRISRKGQDKPIELSATREMIRTQAAQGQTK